jgi:hypothetical protein
MATVLPDATSAVAGAGQQAHGEARAPDAMSQNCSLDVTKPQCIWRRKSQADVNAASPCTAGRRSPPPGRLGNPVDEEIDDGFSGRFGTAKNPRHLYIDTSTFIEA